MVSRSRIQRKREYPLPHNMFSGFATNLETANPNFSNWPIIIQDEARTPGSYFTNPEHASFVEYSSPNCSPDSEIMSIFTEIRFTMTKKALQTDGLGAVRVCFLPIASSFEDLKAIDELTSVEVQDVLEMTSETTDRQAYALWSGVDAAEKYTNSTLLGADVPGLTATQKQEGVVFDIDLWYDAINYYTIAGKLRSVTRGLRWITLTKTNPTRRVLLRQTSKTKRMNPYTQMSVIIGVPYAGTKYQIPMLVETATADHIVVEQNTRYLEWNDMFHAERA